MPGAVDPNRVLIIRPSALGDVCRTVPVLASLRRAYPGAAIDWVVQDAFAEAVAAHPDLSEVIPFPRSRLAAWWRSPSRLRELLGWLRRLRRRRYDLVLDCQGLGRSGLMAAVTAAPVRVGLAGARELAWLGYTIRHRPAAGLHTVDEMMSLLDPIGVDPVADMTLYAAASDAAWWRARRAELDLADRRYAVLAPTSRWPSKRWPAECWRALIDPLRERGFAKAVVVAAPGEVDQVEEILAGADPGVVNLAGGTTVGRSMAVIAEAGLVLANDSAPLHMAVGFDRPCLGLFGPTDPDRVGPYRLPGAVLRAPRRGDEPARSFKDPALSDRLMRRITVAEVLAAVDRVVAPPADATGSSPPAAAVRERAR